MKLGNTATRIIVSLIAIPLIIGTCLLGSYYFLTFISVIGLISYYELRGMSKNKEAKPILIAGSLSVLAFITDSYFHILGMYELTLLVSLLVILTELFRNRGSAIYNIGTTFIGVFYIGLCLSSLIEIREYYAAYQTLYMRGAYLIISVMATIWVCDSAAFFGGTALGKHKMFPRVSPNKSWEGAIFGFVFSVIAMLSARVLVLDFLSHTDAVIIGMLVGTIGQLGDLVESLIKRDAGVKDSSNLIPGHGGIFDRFDSLIATAPVVYLYIKFFVKI